MKNFDIQETLNCLDEIRALSFRHDHTRAEQEVVHQDIQKLQQAFNEVVSLKTDFDSKTQKLNQKIAKLKAMVDRTNLF